MARACRSVSAISICARLTGWPLPCAPANTRGTPWPASFASAPAGSTPLAARACPLRRRRCRRSRNASGPSFRLPGTCRIRLLQRLRVAFPRTLTFELIVQQSPGGMNLRFPPLPLRASIQHANRSQFSQLSPLHHLRTGRDKWPRRGPSRCHSGLQTPYAALARTACLRSG